MLECSVPASMFCYNLILSALVKKVTRTTPTNIYLFKVKWKMESYESFLAKLILHLNVSLKILMRRNELFAQFCY